MAGPEQGGYGEFEGRQLAAEVRGAGGQAILLRGAVAGVQNGLIGGVIRAVAQIGRRAQINELESALLLGQNQVQGLHIAVHHASVVQRLLQEMTLSAAVMSDPLPCRSEQLLRQDGAKAACCCAWAAGASPIAAWKNKTKFILQHEQESPPDGLALMQKHIFPSFHPCIRLRCMSLGNLVGCQYHRIQIYV